MKCPFRTRLVRDFEKAKETVLVKAETIEYPDCYEEECPFYDAIRSTTGCKRIDVEIEEDY